MRIDAVCTMITIDMHLDINDTVCYVDRTCSSPMRACFAVICRILGCAINDSCNLFVNSFVLLLLSLCVCCCCICLYCAGCIASTTLYACCHLALEFAWICYAKMPAASVCMPVERWIISDNSFGYGSDRMYRIGSVQFGVGCCMRGILLRCMWICWIWWMLICRYQLIVDRACRLYLWIQTRRALSGGMTDRCVTVRASSHMPV